MDILRKVKQAMKSKGLNYLKRILVICVLFLLFWEVYALVRYHDFVFFSRLLKGEKYTFDEYFFFLLFAVVFYGYLSAKFDPPVYCFLKDSWEDLKEILANMVKPLGDVKYALSVFIIFVSIFGYEIFNFTLSIDEESHMSGVYPDNTSWCYEGRFSISILKDLLMEFRMFQPCLSNFLGAVILLLAGLCIFSLISDKLTIQNPNKYFSLFFLAGFLSFPPVIADTQSFSTYCIEVSVGIFCTALAVVYLDRYFVTGKRGNLLCNISLLIFVLGIYQAMAGVYISLVIMYFLILIFNEENVTNQKVFYYFKKILVSIVYFLLSVGLFYVIYIFAKALHRYEPSREYINGFSGWDLEYGIFASLSRSVNELIAVLFQTQIPGIKYFTYYMVLGVLLTVFFLIIYPNLKGALCGALTLLFTMSGYFMWVGLASVFLPFRVWQAAPIVSGFLYFMSAYMVRMKLRKKYYLIFQLVLTIVLFRQIQTVNELFYNDHVRMEKDFTFARELYHDICYETGTPTTETPIVLIGTVDLGADTSIINYPLGNRHWGGNILGYSLWNRAQEPDRMRGLYYVLGYTLNIYNCTDSATLTYAWENMTVYPQKGSIVSMNGVVYVRLQ